MGVDVRDASPGDRRLALVPAKGDGFLLNPVITGTRRCVIALSLCDFVSLFVVFSPFRLLSSPYFPVHSPPETLRQCLAVFHDSLG